MFKEKFIAKLGELTEKLINERVEIVNDNEYYFNNKDKFISINIFENINSDDSILVNNWFEKRGVNYSSLMIGYLHELGHYYADKHYNLNRAFYNEQLDAIALLDQIASITNMSDEKHLDLYYKMESEKMANDFVFDMVNRYADLIEQYDREIAKYFIF
jgi:hypothetical protein